MAKINVPVSSLRDLANKLQEYSDENSDVFQRIYNSLECFNDEGDWQGDSLKAALEVTSKNKQKFADVIQEMRTMAEKLQFFVDAMASEDETARKQISTI